MTPRNIIIGHASCRVGHADIGLRADLADNLREVTHVYVPEEKRKQGHGTALMNYLTYAADKHEVALLVEVKSEGEMTSDQLEAFYARHGFVRFQAEPEVLMVRVPQ